MIPLAPLQLTGAAVRAICIARMQSGNRRSRIEADDANIVTEEIAARSAISSGMQHLLTPGPPDALVSADMKWFYENRLRDSAAGREIYEKMLRLSQKRCPFCHLSKPRTLEHSFPQSAFPRLSIEPLNLVPACRDCNFERNVGHGHITISPYFDHWVMQMKWLRAEVLDPRRPEDLEYSLVRPAAMTTQQWAALRQFSIDVNLFSRYTDESIDAFRSLVSDLRTIFGAPSESDTYAALAIKVSSSRKEYGINRWQTAAFEAWLRQRRFIDWAFVLR